MEMNRRIFIAGMGTAAAALSASRVLAQSGDEKGILKVSAYGDISSFDPATSNSGEDHVQLYPIYDRLIDYDFKSMVPVPGLATEWNFTTPTTMELTLREGVVFHDGTPFNAEAVKFSLDRIATHPRGTIKGDLASVEKVEVAGPNKVIIHLKFPDSALPLILSDRAGMMVSPTAVEKLGDDYDRNPVGTGPMKFVEWRDKDRTVYTKFENYWAPEKQKLNGIQFSLIPELPTGLRSVTTGQNDFVYGLAPQLLNVASRASEVETDASTTLFCQLIFFNNARKPLDNLQVRQAFNHAIDRKAFVDLSSMGQYQIAHMLVPSEHWAFDASLADRYPYDPEKARKLLTEAGFADGVDLTMTSFNDQASQQRAEILIEQLKAANIRVAVTNKSTPDANNHFFREKQSDMLLAAWSGRPDPSQSYALMFGSGAFTNPGGIELPEVGSALAETRATSDIDKRRVAFSTLQKAVLDNALFAPLAFQNQNVAYLKRVQDWKPTLLGKPRFDDVYLSA
jgi:peptide/nickel transport system permease protein/peptide/nickel transport system substrate-binding protein